MNLNFESSEVHVLHSQNNNHQQKTNITMSFPQGDGKFHQLGFLETVDGPEAAKPRPGIRKKNVGNEQTQNSMTICLIIVLRCFEYCI